MPIKSFEDVMTEEFARKQQQAARLEQRKQELDYFAQMEAQRQAEREQRQAESFELYKRAQLHREALERGEVDLAQQRASMPTLDTIYQEKAAQARAAEAEAERQRLAAITPRQVWMSTLNYQDRQRVLAWEGVNKQPYPVPGLE